SLGPLAAECDVAPALAQVKELTARVRDLSLRLRPTMLDDLGLLPALVWLFERYTAQTGVRVRFAHRGLEGRFPPETETAADRIVQEALTNAARHSGVREVTVRLAHEAGRLVLEVEDQGAGFDAEAVHAGSRTGGLSGMRERAELLGGRWSVQTGPGAG